VADAWPTYDPDKAKELIDEYVNDPTRSDGKAVGEPVAFRYDCLPEPVLVDLASLYQSFWQEIGVQVELRQVEQATHVSEALAGDFDAKCFRAGLDADPYPTLKNAFTLPSPLNFTRYTDPAIDADLAKLAASGDLDERKDLVSDISMTINEGYPLSYYGSTLAVLAAQDDVKNIDGWTFPEGAKGNGTPGATTMWAFVWNTAA
jgi:peptide/nickel transport system substrate-binding protein